MDRRSQPARRARSLSCGRCMASMIVIRTSEAGIRVTKASRSEGRPHRTAAANSPSVASASVITSVLPSSGSDSASGA